MLVHVSLNATTLKSPGHVNGQIRHSLSMILPIVSGAVSIIASTDGDFPALSIAYVLVLLVLSHDPMMQSLV